MADMLDTLVVAVRADTRGFARDVDAMRGDLEGPLGDGARKAGRMIESALTRAITTGKFGFADLKRIALAVLADIAKAVMSSGLDQLGALIGMGRTGQGQGGGHGGLLNLAGGLLGGLGGLGGLGSGGFAGRATGGPVSPGVAYRVGERGPELFVPTTAGRVEAHDGSGRGARPIAITVNVNAGQDATPERLARSGRQIAREVRRSLMGADSA